MHNAASTGSKAEINFPPSFDDKISVVVLTDTFASVAARAFFQSWRKLVSIAMKIEGDERGKEGRC